MTQLIAQITLDSNGMFWVSYPESSHKPIGFRSLEDSITYLNLTLQKYYQVVTNTLD